MDRRSVNLALLGGLAMGRALPALAAGGRARRTVVYSGIGSTLTGYAFDPDAGTLTKGATIALPSTIQYGWPHPSNRYLYVTTSDAPGGSREIAGTVHRLCALGVGPDGTLAMRGEPQVLRQRPVNNSVDRSGRFALVAYNTVADVGVHPINPDGALGAPIAESGDLDKGIFPHQVRAMPGNRSVVLVTRGNSAFRDRPEDPGALKVYGFDRGGRLSPLQDVVVGGRGGLGYGPRHLDFHPTRPWAYVSLERENELHMQRIVGDRFAPQPDFVVKTTAQAAPGVPQLAGAIWVHSSGRTVYVSNRASGTTDYNGHKVFRGGENSIAVFAIDQRNGEPRQIQTVDPRGFHVRDFTIDPTGRFLVAATMVPMLVRDGDAVRRVPAGLSVFAIKADGTLDFVRKVEVDVPDGEQQVWVRALALPA